MKSNRMRRPLSGISLLEILVAMMCTALLLVMVCQVLPLARRQMKEADQKLGGALLAQNALEEYITVPLNEWPTDPIPVPGEHQTVRLEVLPWQSQPGLRLVRARVMVGDSERYSLETLVTL